MKRLRMLAPLVMLAGMFLAANRVLAQGQTIILQYKYAVSYTDQGGAQRATGYLLVETDTDGNYSAGSDPVMFIYNSKTKRFSWHTWPLTINHDAGRSRVTAHTDIAVFHGATKATTLKGKYGGFTPFSFTLHHVAPGWQGAECAYNGVDNWFVTQKDTLRLDKGRTKHYLEQEEFTMAAVSAHLKRWLEDKGYQDTTP